MRTLRLTDHAVQRIQERLSFLPDPAQWLADTITQAEEQNSYVRAPPTPTGDRLRAVRARVGDLQIMLVVNLTKDFISLVTILVERKLPRSANWKPRKKRRHEMHRRERQDSFEGLS